MLRVSLIAVGPLAKQWQAVHDDYLRRIRHVAVVTELEVPEVRSRSLAAEERLRQEGVRLRKAIPVGSVTVALSREGMEWSSAAFAKQLVKWQDTARTVAFLVGGHDGIAASLIAEVDLIWSLGQLTLPHDLARIVVLEQLYRGFSIIRGTPYHRGPR